MSPLTCVVHVYPRIPTPGTWTSSNTVTWVTHKQPVEAAKPPKRDG